MNAATEPNALVRTGGDRQSLELRILHARNRIADDLRRAGDALREMTSSASSRLSRTVVRVGTIVVAAVLVGVVVAFARRKRRRTIRVTLG